VRREGSIWSDQQLAVLAESGGSHDQFLSLDLASSLEDEVVEGDSNSEQAAEDAKDDNDVGDDGVGVVERGDGVEAARGNVPPGADHGRAA
jgi:hypothetical protein